MWPTSNISFSISNGQRPGRVTMGENEPLTAEESAKRLGVDRLTLYGWLSKSDCGELVIRGHHVIIQYRQTGARGQGKIAIEAQEIERLKKLMQVTPRRPKKFRPPPPRKQHYPGIFVTPGRPDK